MNPICYSYGGRSYGVFPTGVGMHRTEPNRIEPDMDHLIQPEREEHTGRRVLQRHLERLERRLQHLGKASQRYTRMRWTIAVGGLLITWMVARWFGTAPAWGVLIAVIAAFVWVALGHGRVKASITNHTLWHRIKSTHLARMRRDWASIPEPSSPAGEPEHQFASDLNLIGNHSLLHLMDTTMSRGGMERLRSWLLYPVLDREHVRERQAMVREIVPLSMFRDRLALHEARAAQQPEMRWEGEQVIAWLESDSGAGRLLPWVLVLGLLALANGVLYILAQAEVLPRLWPYTLVAYIGLYLTRTNAVRGLFDDAVRLEQTLRRFRAVLLYLESRSYDRTPHLAALCRPFWQAEPRPSAVLKRVVRLADMASAQRANIFGVLLNLLVPWNLYVAYRFNRCKQDVKTRLPEWIETWYDLEALNALANFGYLQPDATFPEIRADIDTVSEPVLRTEALGHPLLPDEVRVCNDFTLAHLGEVVMITGSNMSGKSTFLRTLGVNLCLAYAGAPVCAAVLQTGLMRVFTCINVSDSVTDGISYFYAEVKRLKALLQALSMPSDTPLLFLIDEIFRGTNNRERLIGSQSYIEALTGGHGVGLVSTHDLELVRLAESLPTIHNYHFRETIADGRMAFDYELRTGPCPTTNALTIMQLEGLPVPSTSPFGMAADD